MHVGNPRSSECLKNEMHVLRKLEPSVYLDIPNVLFDGVFSVGNEEEFLMFLRNKGIRIK